MSTKPRATIEDLYKVEGKAELVNGEIVEMPPSGDDPNRASLNIAMSLRQYERRTGQGRAYGDGAGFTVHLPHRESLSPDAAYHLGPRTVGPGDEDRVAPAVLWKGEQSPEASDVSRHLGPVRGADGGPDALDGLASRLDVDAGPRVGGGLGVARHRAPPSAARRRPRVRRGPPRACAW